jgi:hypothetical protein
MRSNCRHRKKEKKTGSEIFNNTSIISRGFSNALWHKYSEQYSEVTKNNVQVRKSEETVALSQQLEQNG